MSDQFSCLHRAQARDTQAFPFPLAALLSLCFLPGLGMLWGCSLQGCGALGSASRPGTESAGAKL